MAKRVFKFPPNMYLTREEEDDDSSYLLAYETVAEAVENNQDEDSETTTVAIYKLVDVKRYRLKKDVEEV